ncbi:Txe/YoeB family addiction module toxin [Chryseobacterium caseinilyticum]|uniref:Putative mRNA interferase YoeB n=1 Tax=Chryseobacterium caseinilyticum TaxID=2771428 RepID=A0ABR8ZEU4_9FLAO|nr:Txe/YoeB family addiction module toxin [Chryseobacterium caseinilyticum]MBD8083410.1 Txe/YoeB family addiction module toxin [Chryseobacterium caseinilyticum]
MGKYRLIVTDKAKSDISKIKKSGNKSDLKKVESFLEEIQNDPRAGTGHPEQLKNFDGEVWSRKVNKKDRFVYEIFEDKILVAVVRALGHYLDK